MEENEKIFYCVQVTYYTWECDIEKYMLTKFKCDQVVFQNNCVLLMRNGCPAVARIECDRLVSIEAIRG